jgi:hypothetical protein
MKTQWTEHSGPCGPRPPAPWDRRAGWAPEPVWTLGLLSLPGTKPRTCSRTSCPLSAYRQVTRRWSAALKTTRTATNQQPSAVVTALSLSLSLLQLSQLGKVFRCCVVLVKLNAQSDAERGRVDMRLTLPTVKFERKISQHYLRRH